MCLFFIFSNIFKQTLNAGDRRIMLFPIKNFGHTLVEFAADHQKMASAAFVIKKGKHIDVHLKLILVQMNIVRRNLVRQSFEIVALEHLFLVKTRLIALTLWESLAFEEVKKCVTEAALVVVLNV